jgi:hypothetical protein
MMTIGIAVRGGTDGHDTAPVERGGATENLITSFYKVPSLFIFFNMSRP